MTILALRGLDLHEGTAVLSENTSSAVAEEAERMGLAVKRSRVGKTFAVLDAEGGVFAAEPSKVVDPKWGLWEDGINASALISTLLAFDHNQLRRALEEVQWKYRQTNLKTSARMDVLVPTALEAFKKFKVSEKRDLDGLKVVLADGSWAMFRPSGTEPVMRIYCESKDLQVLDALTQSAIQCVEASNTS
jgi:phosphopentomutase